MTAAAGPLGAREGGGDVSDGTMRDDCGRLVRDAMFGRYPGAERDPDYVPWENMDQGVRDQYNAGAEAVAVAVRAEYAGLVAAARAMLDEYRLAVDGVGTVHRTVNPMDRALQALPPAARDEAAPHDTPEGIPDDA